MNGARWLHLSALVAATAVHGDAAAPQPPAVQPCIACRADAAAVRAELGEERWAKLARGEVVTLRADVPAANGESSTQTEVQSLAIFDHPPERVWEVLTDFEARPRYFKDLKELKIVRREGNRYWLSERVRVFLFNIRYQVINTLDPERGTVAWKLDKSVAHDIAETTGAWQMAPLDERRKTLLHYRAHIDTGQPVPEFIESFLTERSLPGLVAAVRGEVERRFAGAK